MKKVASLLLIALLSLANTAPGSSVRRLTMGTDAAYGMCSTWPYKQGRFIVWVTQAHCIIWGEDGLPEPTMRYDIAGLPAYPLTSNKKLDLATFGGGPQDVKPLKLARNSPVMGEEVYILGVFLGIDFYFSRLTVASPRFTDKDGVWMYLAGSSSKGMSGSPVWNKYGEVVTTDSASWCPTYTCDHLIGVTTPDLRLFLTGK